MPIPTTTPPVISPEIQLIISLIEKIELSIQVVKEGVEEIKTASA